MKKNTKITKVLLFFFFAAVLWMYGFPQTGKTAKNNTADEIVAIQKEILRLKELLKELAQLSHVVSREQEEKLNAIIKELETQIEKQRKRREEKYSAAAREVNKLKQNIDRLKEDLKALTGGIAFSGFFDVGASGYKNNPNIFALGDFELDMEKSFGKNFQVASALVFNDDGAELAVGFIDFHLFGGPVAARGRLFTEKGLHIQVGRFDVPFGNDWQYYAPVDRVSVSPPLSTEMVMDGGYNDVGLRILRANVTYNYTLFMLRGIEEGFSFGGRFGFTPFNNPFTLKKRELQLLEIGVSYMHDVDRGGTREERALALDFEGRVGPVRFQGEYIRRDYDIETLRLEGYHLSTFLDIGEVSRLPVTLFGRYDHRRERPYENGENGENGDLSRLTVGVNVNLFDISMLKLEFLHFLKENETFSGSSFFAQLVITF